MSFKMPIKKKTAIARVEQQGAVIFQNYLCGCVLCACGQKLQDHHWGENILESIYRIISRVNIHHCQIIGKIVV